RSAFAARSRQPDVRHAEWSVACPHWMDVYGEFRRLGILPRSDGGPRSVLGSSDISLLGGFELCAARNSGRTDGAHLAGSGTGILMGRSGTLLRGEPGELVCRVDLPLLRHATLRDQ